MSDINVTITFDTVDDEIVYKVSQSFIRIPENSTQTIIWTIVTTTGVPSGTTIQFDDPAITLFGGDALVDLDNIAPDVGLSTARLEWENTHPGKSVYYRLHMVGHRSEFSEAFPEYFAIDHDPTIHNDPPS